jgi:hypothetical protein
MQLVAKETFFSKVFVEELFGHTRYFYRCGEVPDSHFLAIREFKKNSKNWNQIKIT